MGLGVGPPVSRTHGGRLRGRRRESRGGAAPIDAWSDPNDDEAQTPDDIVSTGFLENAVTRQKIEHTVPLNVVEGEAYDGVFLAGGYGALYDFPDNEELVRVVREVWASGGVVGAICHGAAGLPSLVDGDGNRIIDSRTVTGFLKAEDEAVESTVGTDFLQGEYVEDHLRETGATYVSGGPFQPFAVTSSDDRIVTGQQQFSGHVFGEELVAALDATRPLRASRTSSASTDTVVR